MDILAYADRYMKQAQSLQTTTGLSIQQRTYRNHLIRIDQQTNELVDSMYSVLHPEIVRTQHPEWQRYNIVAPTFGPTPLTGQPLLKPEALSYAQTLRNLVVRFNNSVLRTPNLAIADMIPLFNQIVGTFETIRTSYAVGPVMNLPGIYLPMRQIRDSLAWMNQYQQTALRQAGQTAAAIF